MFVAAVAFALLSIAAPTSASAASADLSIVKTGPATAVAGQNITYSITVSNAGPDDALSAILSDTLPSFTTFVSFVQNSGPASGGTLPAGGTQTFTLVVKVNAGTPAGTVVTNTANITSTTSDPNPANNSSAVTTTVSAPAPPTITKAFGAASIAVNGSTSLTFTIANPNPVPLTGIGFTDTFPAGMVVSTPNGLTGSCGGGTITATAAGNSTSLAGTTLAANASCTFSVNVTGTSAGVKTNSTSTVSSNEGGPGTPATASITVIPVSPPTISKAFGAASIAVNGSTSLTFTIANPNPVPLTGIGFTDTFPAGTVVSTPNGLTGSCGGGTITATAAGSSTSLAGSTLAANASCTFSVSVTGTSAGVKNNTTSTVSSNEAGPGTPASASIIVQGGTTTALTSSQNPSQFGQAVTLTATITAAGTPTGTVTFKDGATAIGTVATAGNSAAFTTSALVVGSHSITATYNGNATFNASTSAALIQVVNTPTDSLRLRALQILATKVVAQNSGQAISGAVDTAIADGFSDGGDFVTPGAGGSMHFNFTSDPEQQYATSAGSTISDRWNGAFRSEANSGSMPVGQGPGSTVANGYTRNQSPSRADDAFASIDRNAMPTKAPARIVEPKEWMLWADVRASGINRWDTSSSALTPVTSTTLATLSGYQVNALMGLTRKFNPSFLVGVLGGYETFDYRSDALTGRLKGEGWTVGSYLGWKMTPNIRFVAGTAYSGITYNGVAGTAAGNFDGNRWLVTGGLVGTYRVQAFEIEPSTTVYALWERENAYTDSLGTMQTDRKFFTGRASGGAKLIYPMAWTSTITLAPYIGLYGDYYFSGDDAAVAAIAGAIPLASTPILQGWSARAVGGLAARFANGATIALGAELGGIGGTTQIWTFRGRGSVPF